jgi:plasmid stabilization system protein ParE
MEVRWSPRASNDLERIFNRIREDNPVAAQRVAKSIYDGRMSLQQFPNCGRIGRMVA